MKEILETVKELPRIEIQDVGELLEESCAQEIKLAIEQGFLLNQDGLTITPEGEKFLLSSKKTRITLPKSKEFFPIVSVAWKAMKKEGREIEGKAMLDRCHRRPWEKIKIIEEFCEILP